MPNYRRNYVPGGTYFFTVALLDRRGDFLVRYVDALRDAVRRVQRSYPFEIAGWVVLPEHLHCVWILPENDADYATRWRLIKLLFCKQLPKTERLSVTRQRKGERGIWQRRYWEHTIRNPADFAAHMDYLHFNPVKHGWVKPVADWPYSTFHALVRDGVYPADWGGAEGLSFDAGESP